MSAPVLKKSAHDCDGEKGSVESDLFGEHIPVSMTGQLLHRTQDEMLKDADSDFPEPGFGPEHS